MAGEGADHTGDHAVLGEHQLDGGAVVVGGVGGLIHAGQAGDRAERIAAQGAHLQAKDHIALEAALEAGGRVAGEHAARVDNRHAVAQLLGLGHVVGGEQHGAGGLCGHPALHKGAQLARGAHIQAERRLVEEDHLWVGEEAAHDIHLLAQAGGEVGALGVGAVG